MRLAYQWALVIFLGFLVWAIHTYGGSGCSKPFPSGDRQVAGHRPPFIPPLKIIVQRRIADAQQVETSDCPQANQIPQVPVTPPSKTVSQRRRERRKAAKLKQVNRESDEIEWDFCTEKMIQ